MRVIACRTPFGKGGLGQHFAFLVEESRASGELAGYYAHTIKPGDERIGHLVDFVKLTALKRYSPLRFMPTWMGYVGEEVFDKRVARQLDVRADAFMGFVGKSLHTFGKARALGYTQLELIAANSHVRNVQRRHAEAARQLGIRDTWLNDALARKTLREYDAADVIYTHSEYTRASLIEGGVPERKLKRTFLTADPRFVPPVERTPDGRFRIVYIGRIDATKGVPLLIEAFTRLQHPDAELTLVGGWATSVMKRKVQEWIARDPRIRLAPGDPVPVLHRADIYVHPTYEDGFAYAPVEALACGVPVIVTEDTGMKERVREGENGFVVPTGSWEAILERLEYVVKHPLTFDAGACAPTPAMGE
ncbi:MAG: glycosyltransferase family 4 protein [Rhodothermales bacterium]